MVGVESDLRIILAEGVTKFFANMVRNRQIPLSMNREKVLHRLTEINSKLMALKWSYLPLEQVLLSKDFRAIEIFAKEIFDSFPPNWEETLGSRGTEGQRLVGLLKFIRDFYYRLRERMSTGFSEDLSDAMDIFCGEVLSIDLVSKGVWKCLVADGQARYNVITAIEGVKKGEIVPIAKLPPQIVHGIYSEGMFMGSSEGLRRFTKEDIGKRPELTDKELGQSRGILKQQFLSQK